MNFILSAAFRFQTGFTVLRVILEGSLSWFSIDFFSLSYHFNFDVHFSVSSYRKLFVTCRFNIFDLSCFSFLFSEDDPSSTSGIEFFAITGNGLWLLAVVIKSSILDVHFWFRLSIRFSVLGLISAKELSFSSTQCQLKKLLNLSSLGSVWQHNNNHMFVTTSLDSLDT